MSDDHLVMKLGSDWHETIQQFRMAYADRLVKPNRLVPADRVLRWKSKHRVSLELAACVCNEMLTYNEFRAELIDLLHKAFPDKDISVTLAREYSVAIYLHIPGYMGLQRKVERFVKKNLGADEISWYEDASMDNPVEEGGTKRDWSKDRVLRIWWD